MGRDRDRVVDQSTAKEIRNWIDKKYRLPLGVVKMVKVDGGSADPRKHFLREDADKVWKEALTEIVKLGAILVPASGVGMPTPGVTRLVASRPPAGTASSASTIPGGPST